jgi:2-oxoisovalerate dehydrogenase E2 component (dihydrolipoyl transacylase)
VSISTVPGTATANARTFMLPDLGEGLTEAEVIEWHVAQGDEVQVDQIVVTVETAKATVDLPCPYAGSVLTLHSGPGAVLEVGRPLLTIGTQEMSDAPGKPVVPEMSGSGNVLVGYGTSESRRSGRRRVTPAGRPPAIDVAGSGEAPGTHTANTPAPTTPVKAPAAPTVAPKAISPVVRKLARDNGINLAELAPTGHGHVIRRADVEAVLGNSGSALGKSEYALGNSESTLGNSQYARAQSGSAPGTGQAAPNSRKATPGRCEALLAAHEMTPSGGPFRADRAGDIRIPLRGTRKTIADKLTRSRREIPEATVWVDVDATRLLALKDEIKAADAAAGIGLLALFARISVAGLAKFPELNARVDVGAQEIVQLCDINLSFAAQSPRGLVVPVVHGAGEMTTAELAAALRELTELARDGRLTPAQMTGGTFTLNNYGVFGTDGATPIINYPEAAMLGVGRIIDRPWAYQGEVALRKVAQLGLTFDHRVCDGGTAGGFLRFVADCVERPALLLAGL